MSSHLRKICREATRATAMKRIRRSTSATHRRQRAAVRESEAVSKPELRERMALSGSSSKVVSK